MSRFKLSVRLRNHVDSILMKYESDERIEERPFDVNRQLTELIKKIPSRAISKVPQNAQEIYKFPLWESIAKAARIASLANMWDIPPQKIQQYIPNQDYVCSPHFLETWDKLRKDDSKNIIDLLNQLKNKQMLSV